MKAENRIISKFDYFSFRLLSDPLIGCYLFEFLRRQRHFDFGSGFSHAGIHELSPNKLEHSASFDFDWSEKSVLNEF
jgi:hypothetical protein